MDNIEIHEMKTDAIVEIYTTKTCPYCIKAKNLLNRKNIKYKEIDVTNNDELRMALIDKSGGRKTVPQIFINNQHVGGFDDINALDQKGELDKFFEK